MKKDLELLEDYIFKKESNVFLYYILYLLKILYFFLFMKHKMN